MKNDWIPSSMGICIDGVNSSLRPDLIGPNQLAWMVNGTVRDGKPRTRVGLKQRLALPSGKVQGAGFYSAANGLIILSIGGRLYRVILTGNSFAYEEIALGFVNSSVLDDAWMVETPSGIIVQDGQSAAIIYNGATARRADLEAQEVPLGKMMAYGNGRLWVVLANGRNLVAGDITTGTPGSELLFTENVYLLGGGAFYFPNGITGLAFLPVNNTATGYGSLMVFGRRSVNSIRAEVTERDLWQIIPGFETIVLDGIGTPSHHSITRVDQDLYWRDESGQIRSLRSAAQAAQGPGNTPLSLEMQRVIAFETLNWLRFTSGIYVDNRVLFTAAPLNDVALPQNVVFQKLISLDCAPLATMRGKAPPAYDGEWTGVNIARVVQGTFRGTKRAFAIVRDADGGNSLWEFDLMNRNDSYIDDGSDVPVSIESGVEFRRFDFGLPSIPKQLTRCDVYPSQIEGEVTMRVDWRVGNRNQWQEWGTFTVCAEMEDPAPNVQNILASPLNLGAVSWIPFQTTVTTGQTAPDASANAALVRETVDDDPHGIRQASISWESGKKYECIINVKAAGRTKGKLAMIGSGVSVVGAFDLTAHSLVVTTVGATPPTIIASSMILVGVGWYQIRIVLVWQTSYSSGLFVAYLLNDAGSDNYPGDPTKGLYMWNPQFQLSPDPHVFKNLRSQERGRVKSLTVPDLEETIQKLAQNVGYSFQIRLVWTGNVTIDRIDVFARPLTDKQFSDVFDLSESCAQDTVENNELQYTIIPAS